MLGRNSNHPLNTRHPLVISQIRPHYDRQLGPAHCIQKQENKRAEVASVMATGTSGGFSISFIVCTASSGSNFIPSSHLQRWIDGF